MKIRLYMDEDSMSRDLIRALQAHDFDVESPLDAGMIERMDPEQLEYATSQDRVLLSGNIRDFHRIHSEYMAIHRTHSGIILVPRGRFSIGEQLRRMLKLAATRSAREMRNRLEFLNSWS